MELLNLKPCPSCGFKHPLLVTKRGRIKDMETGKWSPTQTWSIVCPNCIMRTQHIDNREWPIKCWNTRAKPDET